MQFSLVSLLANVLNFWFYHDALRPPINSQNISDGTGDNFQFPSVISDFPLLIVVISFIFRHIICRLENVFDLVVCFCPFSHKCRKYRTGLCYICYEVL